MLPIPVSYPAEYSDIIHGYRLMYSCTNDRLVSITTVSLVILCCRVSELTPLTSKEEEESISDHPIIQENDELRSRDRDPESDQNSSTGTINTSVPLSSGKVSGVMNVRKRVAPTT